MSLDNLIVVFIARIVTFTFSDTAFLLEWVVNPHRSKLKLLLFATARSVVKSVKGPVVEVV